MHPVLRSAVVLAGLAGINVAAQRSRLDPDVVVPVGAAALLVAARTSGLTRDELGLGGAQTRQGAARALGAAAATVGGVSLVASLPAAGVFFIDTRYPSAAAAWRGALVKIPLSVAVPEEILFRSVLDAALRRHLSSSGAAAAGALAFGAWHALGATTLTHENAGIGDALGQAPYRGAVGVLGAVLATGLAGLGFTALRRRTDSVLPGIAVHWALNSAGALAAGLRGRH